MSRSLDSEDVQALKALDGSTGIQAGWARRSLSRCTQRQPTPTRSPIRNSRPKPIRRNNVKYHKMFKAYLDNGEEPLADLDPNSLSAHFLRRSLPTSAVPDSLNEGRQGGEEEHDAGFGHHRQHHARPFTSDAMGFVADTSSFLLVSSLSTTPQKKSHMRQPPNTAPSSMQSLPYAFPARSPGKRRTEPDVWRSPEEDEGDDGVATSGTSFNSPRVSRAESPLKPRTPPATTPITARQPIAIDKHPANARLGAPSDSKLFPSFREGRLHSLRVHSVEAARRKATEPRFVRPIMRMSTPKQGRSLHQGHQLIPKHHNAHGRPLSDTHAMAPSTSQAPHNRRSLTPNVGGDGWSREGTTWARPRGTHARVRAEDPSESVSGRLHLNQAQAHSYRRMQAQC